MADSFELEVYDRGELVYSDEFSEPVELGRQQEHEKAVFAKVHEGGRTRLVIARWDETNLGRRQALLEPLPDGRLRLSNLSAAVSIRCDSSDLAGNSSCEVSLPATLNVGKKMIRLLPATEAGPQFQGLAEATVAPGHFLDGSSVIPRLGGQLDDENVIRWLQAAMDVHHSAAGSSDFFDKAARAVVDLVHLDSAQVSLLEQNEWKVQALYVSPEASSNVQVRASRQILAKVRQEKRTFRQMPGEAAALSGASLVDIKAAVAAPILDRQGDVIGAVYGDRRQGSRRGAGPEISKTEAMLVELLASAVAAGLARVEQERVALAARVQFEQFFTPELARQLAVQPDLLKGRDCEVSILFSDIRGFSRVSERLGPAGTVEWMNSVMGALSDCVLAQQGVLVDYIGDEIVAMWGAPEVQPNHAQLACRAACAMMEQVPVLNEKWQPFLHEPMSLGIGINTGIARVGNTGSHRKFKYGPLGNTVNVASRVQGATKYLKTAFLVTASTHEPLAGAIPSRRLGKVTLVNIHEPVELYELLSGNQADFVQLKTGFEQALVAFEQHDFRGAIRILGNVLSEYPNDGPSLILLSRAVSGLVEDPESFDAVWQLPGK